MFVGAASVARSRAADQAVADEPVEDLVEVSDVELAPLGADRLAEFAELVAVAGVARVEQGKDSVLDRHLA